jgi:hypothetical protein
MARITWLADVLRAAGCTVREDDTSWKTRGGSTFDPRGLIIHATAGGLLQSNDSAYNVLVNGRVGLAGPISQVMVERGTGRWRPVCSGRSNHALTGWGGNCSGLGNANLIGIEYHHANTAAEPWTEQMLDNYARGAAAICRHMGWGVDRVALHKEHQPGDKSDTTFDGNAFRARVQRFLNPTPLPTPQQEDEDMATLYHVIDDNGTPINTDDMAIFAYLGGGICRVAAGPVQTLANKVARPPSAPDKGTGDSSPLTKAEWNDLMEWMGVPGNRFDDQGIFHTEPA